MDVAAANVAVTIIAWTILFIFFIATVFWVVEMVVIGRAPRSPIKHLPGDIEVRILTVDAESVVQGTVTALPDTFSRVRVISEHPITITGASVHVVPDHFTCNATRKARAVEWARQHVPCSGRYVLYLDEDTLLQEFHGLPDADIVQLSEQPIRSDSWITYLAEIFRMGFQLEQATFPKFRHPLYAWGGGFAVRKTVEDDITWDVASLTEDTNFVWRAFETNKYDMEFLNVRARNQAPPSIREMIHQRRRWISGAARDSHLLPRRYQLLTLIRNAAWGLVAVSPLMLIPFVTPLSVLWFPEFYQYGILIQLTGLFGWAVLGYWYYGERPWVLALLILTVPVIAVVHAAGAFWAIISPAKTFRVTRKVPPQSIKDDRVTTQFDLEEQGVGKEPSVAESFPGETLVETDSANKR